MSINYKELQQIGDALQANLKAQFNNNNIGVNAIIQGSRYVVNLVNMADYSTALDNDVVSYAQKKAKELAPRENLDVKAVSYPVERGVPQFFHPK